MRNVLGIRPDIVEGSKSRESEFRDSSVGALA